MASGTMSAEVRASILLKLAEQVISARKLEETAEFLVKKPLLLHRYVIQTPIDWRKIAEELSEDRSRIYHWYRETHSRNILNVKMTSEDRRAIKEMIVAGIKDGSILNQNFYHRIHERFGTKYSRQELRMTYNNALRTQSVRAALEEYSVVLPPRRTYDPKIMGYENELLSPPIMPSNLVPQAPYMVNYTTPPPTQAIGVGWPVLMSPSSPIPAPTSVMPAFSSMNTPGYFVTGVSQPGFVTGSGALPLQMMPSLPSMQIGQDVANLSPNLSYAPHLSPVNSGGQRTCYSGAFPYRN